MDATNRRELALLRAARTPLLALALLALAACESSDDDGGGAAPDDPAISFAAARQSIAEGESTTLVWSVDGGSAVTISPEPGAVEPEGRARVTPAETTRYELAATLAGGERASRAVTVSVVPLAAVRIAASAVSGDAPLTVRFTPVLDSTTAINRLFWDFEGDGGEVDGGLGDGASGFDRLDSLVTGRADYDVTGQDVTHTYGRAGEFEVRVRVIDVDGNAAEDTLTVTARNAPPVGYATAVPNRGQAPLGVSFEVRASDSDGIDRYDWDFDGDGRIDETTTRRSTSFTYETPGEYRPLIVVHDTAGQSTDLASPAATVSVTATPVPRVSLAQVPLDGEQPLEVRFEASVSVPGGGDIAGWAWDFDGDGQVDSREPDEVTHVFDTAGVWYPRLTVSGGDGSVGRAIGRVEVSATLDLAFTDDAFDPSAGGGTTVTLDSGGPAVVTLGVEDLAGNLVRTLATSREIPAGESPFAWDGRDDAGRLLAPGAYRARLAFERDGESVPFVPEDESADKVFYPSGWGGRCVYSETDCGTLTVSDNDPQPFNENPTVYAFDIPRNARMTAYLTIIGSEDFAPATFFRSRMLARGEHRIEWFGEGTTGRLLERREDRGYLPAIYGITLGRDVALLTHDARVADLRARPPIVFPLEDGGGGTYTFSLDRPADIVLTVDSTDSGVQVLRRVFEDIAPGEAVSLPWDGRDNTGERVAPGGYRIGVTARDAFGIESRPAYAMQRVRY